MDLATLRLDIRDELNKGSVITDAQIDRHIQQALTALELKHGWGYMDRFVTFTIDAAAAEPRAIPYPSRVKSFEFIRFVLADGRYHNLRGISPSDITKVEVELPSGYFVDSDQYIWFDNIPGENYSGEMSYKQFTLWVADDAFEPWLFKYASHLVKYQALMFMAAFVREAELATIYKALRDEALTDALRADEELEYANQPMSMLYK